MVTNLSPKTVFTLDEIDINRFATSYIGQETGFLPSVVLRCLSWCDSFFGFHLLFQSTSRNGIRRTMSVPRLGRSSLTQVWKRGRNTGIALSRDTKVLIKSCIQPISLTI